MKTKIIFYMISLIAVMVFAGMCARPSGTESEAVAEEPLPRTEHVFTCTSAGRWFPADPGELRSVVDQYLKEAENKEISGRIVALISPHAGYQFSAPVAAYAYKPLEGLQFDTVAVVGFSHGVYDPNVNVYPEGSFRTPLGDIPIDREAAAALIASHPQIVSNTRIFTGEHSLDNQLPFLQRTLGSFKLLPIIMGSQTQENIEILSESLAGVLKGKNVLLVASTDMSHFWEYEEANKLDAEMNEMIGNFDIDGVARLMSGDTTGKRLCGHGATRAVMRAARLLGADSAKILKYANSQDTYGPTGRGVVGYVAAALVESGKESVMEKESVEGELNNEDKKELLKIARKSLETYIREGKNIKVDTENPALQQKRGMFVTLEIDGRLRGCMGHFEDDTRIGELSASQIIDSAIHDSRFPRVSEKELESIDIEISVLSVPEPVGSYENIVVGKHGVILEKHGKRATFLPQVAPEQGWDRDTMLSHLSTKARLSSDAWKKGASFKVYTAQVFGEEDFDE